jgi:hypothetical protein
MTRHFGIDSSISLVLGVNANVMYFAYYGLLLLLKIIAEGVLYNQFIALNINIGFFWYPDPSTLLSQQQS